MFNDADEELDPLDLLGDDVEEVFGSYQRLVKLDTYRFVHPRRAAEAEAGAGQAKAAAGMAANEE